MKVTTVDPRPTTVRDLIEFLSTQPPDRRVLVDGYEGGLDDPALGTVRAWLDDSARDGGYWGKHDEIHDNWPDLKSELERVRADCVLISRTVIYGE